MILGTGNDLVDINRIRVLYERFGNKFLKKIYTKNELVFFSENKNKFIQRLANRFAAKEAFYKALNHNKKSKIPSFQDVEILNLEGGQPEIKIFNAAEKLCLDLVPKSCNYNIHVSLSDEKNYCSAFVIIESVKHV